MFFNKNLKKIYFLNLCAFKKIHKINVPPTRETSQRKKDFIKYLEDVHKQHRRFTYL